MANPNSSHKEEAAQITPAAFLMLQKNPDAGAAQNATVSIHPGTLDALAQAANYTRTSVLDFIMDAAWANARAILSQPPPNWATKRQAAKQPD